jgi:hypothetical protein
MIIHVNGHETRAPVLILCCDYRSCRLLVSVSDSMVLHFNALIRWIVASILFTVRKASRRNQYT